MKLSNKKMSELFISISEPIMKARIKNEENGLMTTMQIDDLLFNLQGEIWREVHSTLNLDKPA